MSAVRALVRPPGPRFVAALNGFLGPAGAALDPERARAQHAGVVEALRALGLRVEELRSADDHPDGCFVEDHAVVVGRQAILLRTGAPTRRAEAGVVHAAVKRWMSTLPLVGDGTVDGGDVLVVGRTVYVGVGPRTTAAGADALRRTVPPGFTVREVPLPPGQLHLKCGVSQPHSGFILLADTMPFAPFAREEVRVVDGADAYAANALGVGDTVLLPAGYPRVRRIVEAEGLAVRELPMDELRKADGSLTCLALLLPG